MGFFQPILEDMLILDGMPMLEEIRYSFFFENIIQRIKNKLNNLTEFYSLFVPVSHFIYFYDFLAIFNAF